MTAGTVALYQNPWDPSGLNIGTALFGWNSLKLFSWKEITVFIPKTKSYTKYLLNGLKVHWILFVIKNNSNNNKK